MGLRPCGGHRLVAAFYRKGLKVLRKIGRFARRILQAQADESDLAPRISAAAMAEFLAGGVEGASFVWCGCGSLLVPIVYGDGEQAEVIALGCLHGHGGVPVASGVLIDGDSADRPSLH
jgi:hypothetical protein